MDLLRVETKTWTRDSHDLFDYEAQQVNKKSFLISTAIKLFRSKAQVSCVADSPECLPNTTQDYLLSVRPQEDKYVITPAEHSLSNQYNIKKLWIIVKDLPEKYYALHENDIIKLGRFRLKVRQFIESVDTLNTLKLDDCPSKKCEMILDSSNIQCRICLIEGNQENDPLICPCDCKGSIKYAHLMCLRKWINGRLNLNDQLFSGSVFIKDICCELCKSKYPKSIKQNEELVQLVKIPNLKTPLIVLDNIIGQTSKGVHLISFADKKYLKLGRGHESDVRIPDVSISRYHATIKYEKGLFKLEDHNSKFGTLVALRKAREIYPKDTMSLQVGRSVVQFKMDEEIPFKSGIIDIIENKEVLDSSEAPTNDKSTVNSAPPVNTTSNTDETNNRNNFERNQFMDITNASNSLQSSYSPYRVDNLMSLLNYQNEYRIFGIRNCYNLMENRNNQQLIPQMNFVPGSNIDMNNDEINNDQHLLHHRDSHIQANADEVAHNDCEETQQPRDISNQSNDDNDDDDEEEENHVNDQNDDDEDNNDNDHNDNNNSGGGSSSGSSDNNSNSNRGGNNNSQYYGNNSNNNNNNSNNNNNNNSNNNSNNNNNNYNNNYNNNCKGHTDYSDISSTPKKNTIKDYNKFNKIHVGNLPIDISNIYDSNNGPKDIVSNSDFIKNSSTPYSIRKNKLSYNNDLLKQKNKCHDMDETVEKILSSNENKYEKESLSNDNKNEIYTNYNMDENNSSFFFSNMKTPSVIDFFKYDNSSSVSYNQSKTRMDERYKNGKLVEEYNNNDKKLKKNSSSSSNIYHKNNYHTINRNNHMDNIIKKDQHLNNSKFVQDNDEYNINDKITTRSSLNCNKINISKDISSFNNFSLGTSNVSNINLYNTYELYNSDIVHYMYPNEDTKNDNNCSTPRKYMRYENNRIDDMNNKFNEINTHNVDKKIFKDTTTRKYSYTNINKMNQNNYMKNEYNNNNLSGSINCIETNFTYNNIGEKFSYNNKMIKGNTLKKNYMSNSCDEINTCNKKMKKNLTEEIKENKDNILNVEERLEKSINNNNNNIEIDLNEKTSSNSYQNFKSAVFKKRMIGSPYTNINTYKNDIPNESFNLNMKEKSYNELETYHSLPNVNINSNNVLNKFNDNKKYSHNNINNNRTYKLYNKHQTGISTDKSNKINQLNGKDVYVCTSKHTSNQSCDVYRKNEDSNHDDEHITSSECRRKSNAQHVIPLNEEIKNNDKIFSDHNVKNDMNEKYKNVKNNKHRLSTYDNLSHKRRMNNIKIDNSDHYSKNKCNNGSLKNKNIEKHSSYNFENDSKDLTPNQVDSSSSHLDHFVNEQKKQMKDIQRTISMVTIQDEDNNILNNLQEENNNNLNINNGSKLKNKSTCEDDKGTQLKYKNITSTNYDHKYNNLFAMKDNNTSNHNIYMNQQKKRCTAKY